ncbi:sialidase family protein [Inhella gelatinilytica]|uniref:Exo-alpha-sialidase n=1 Tax=Inhella gelatinilytica TaxID=2795030 RepID=A0A931IRP4_9BURK|nr:sialidase family protein [Inhella gelatinilytica]MBH9551440.1 exo-alpha-sialidase [Inhella gelatinilytica]
MKFETPIAGLLLLALSACGGGGGSAPAPAPAPPPAPAPFALPTSGKVSAPSPIATNCTGGTTGTVYTNSEVEPWLAAHPGNPNVLAAGWQQDRWNNGGARATMSAVSTDGGVTWRRTLHPFSRCGGAVASSAGDYERASDPWVDIGPDGAIHAMALAFSGTSFQAGSVSAMLATRSLDNGVTWEPVKTLAQDGGTLFHDKNALTADRTDGRYVYAVWDRLDSSGFGPTLLARSSDRGANWEPTRIIYSPSVAGGISQTIGNRIVVLNDGRLVNVFTQIDTVGSLSTNWVGVIRSNDKGLTWSAPVRVAEHRTVGVRDPQTNQAIRSGGIIPTVAVGGDNSLWLAWQDARFHPTGNTDGIVLSRSVDGGQTWSAPQAVNRRLDAGAFTPNLAARADGSVALLYFDLRDDTPDATTLPTSAWLATSRDGSTWQESRVWGPFDLAKAPDARGLFLGDYMGLVNRGTQWTSLLSLSQNDLSNRTDVFLFDSGPTASALAYRVQRQPGHSPDDPALRVASHAATQAWLEQRRNRLR